MSVYEPAVIFCEGNCKNFTQHVFHAQNRVGTTIYAYEQRYRCSVCGTTRRYGLTATASTSGNGVGAD